MAMTDREQNAALDDLELAARMLEPGHTNEARQIARALVKSVMGRMLDSLAIGPCSKCHATGTHGLRCPDREPQRTE